MHRIGKHQNTMYYFFHCYHSFFENICYYATVHFYLMVLGVGVWVLGGGGGGE